MIDQYNVLKKRIRKVFIRIIKKRLCNSFNKDWCYYGEDLQKDIEEFLKALNLESSKSNEYKIDENLPYFIQDLIFIKKDSSKTIFCITYIIIE